ILSRSTRLTNTDLSYHGSGTFYSSDTGLDTQTHRFGVAETLQLRRWTVTLADNLSYVPEGRGGLPEFGQSGNGADLGNQYIPNGTILTPVTKQLNNTSVAEIDFGFTRRTSFTANGSYAELDFPDSSLQDTSQRTLGGGINHSYGRNTVGVSYTNTMFRYQDLPESMQTHSATLSFARRVSAKYSF